ncbi:thioredoxin-like negative regulator of GroEL [Novosphingobium hassiacum]|uniref:Thioredoxin-like negative regulator of GroEL n=2 Tax=Novosphingobium hassiacum TaxID=173676 RepID=A0A7W5ZZ50_9SPHN|nr:sulfotransferase [Novosphingobium hassiacum]MBB3860340.1 thioredoxin-like negative regulator of GroEL [Novosphingobium hassiacum]
MAQVLAATAQLLAQHPHDAEANFVAAVASAESGRIGEALGHIKTAVEASPDNAEYLAQYARILLLGRREGEAMAAARRGVKADSDKPLVLDTLGCVFARLGAHDEALPLFERAVSASPEAIEYRFNLASTLGFFGRVDEAAAQYEAIIARQPAHGRAHLGLVGLHRSTTAGQAQRIEDALPITQDPVERVRLHYAAAAVLENAGEADQCFAHLASGNAIHRAALAYDFSADEAVFDAIRRAFSRELPLLTDSTVVDAPLFVVGLPRTGTTLVDRILSSHPAVTSAGELQAMPLAVKQLSQTRSRLVLDPATVEALAGRSAHALGELYLTRARQNAGAASARFTDKFPLNFLYIGWIVQALPNANIVCLRRGAMDTVWSNFKHLFATGSPYYRWSYDLMDTAHYVLMFQRLMAFWRQRFPGRVHEVNYEQLVADQETQTRRMLAHCGLGWNAACLDFHANAAAVATPSAQQVRQPINARAVGRWHDYERQLDEVMEFFVAKGIPLD